MLMLPDIKKAEGFEYIETNPGKEPFVLLHGLFGSLSNFNTIIRDFKDKYNIIIPVLPIYSMPTKTDSLEFLLDYVSRFISFKRLNNINLLGNSLGGHLAQMFVLKNSSKVKSLILTGSSGLFESGGLGSNTFLKRGDYSFVKMKTQGTFFDPATATKEMVDEVFDAINDRHKAIRLILAAKSAMRHNLESRISKIKTRSLLIWGKQDEITPPFVAEKFHELLTNSKLVFLDKCGHAPMMEQPSGFNDALKSFFSETKEFAKAV